jgi:hypothetical protein
VSYYIRTCRGVPPVSQFAAKDGTPLIIDLDTGYLYYLDKQTVKMIRTYDTNIFYFEFRFDIDTTAADPGSGDVRLNDGTRENVTAVYISETSSDSLNVDLVMNEINIGDALDFMDKSNPNNRARYIVTGLPVDNGTWWTIPVEFFSLNGSMFGNNHQLRLAVELVK